MFTGLIEATGKVTQTRSLHEGKLLQIEVKELPGMLHIGDSIAVDGACLSVTALSTGSFSVLAVKETLERTTFEQLKSGDIVNLERALSGSARLEGHIVQGHIDTVAKIVGLDRLGDAAQMVLEIPAGYQNLTVEKGSIAVNGVSLTIAKKKHNHLTIALIPLTLAKTNLGQKKVGQYVNVEFDILAKYVVNYLQEMTQPGDVDSIVAKWGFVRK